MARNYLISLVFYYTYAYIVLYGITSLLQPVFPMEKGLASLLITPFIILLLYLIGAIASFKLRGEKLDLEGFGLRKYGGWKSFVYSAALSTPIPVFWLIGTRIVGLNTIMIATKPIWTDSINPPNLLIGGLGLWLMTSIITLIFWIAVPYELSRNFSVNVMIPVITILWAGLYNTPFLTGKIDPIDVFFFGLLYAIVYHRTGNIVGLIISYLIVENPLWWVISTLIPFNSEITFLTLLVTRSAVCIIMLMIVITRYININLKA